MILNYSVKYLLNISYFRPVNCISIVEYNCLVKSLILSYFVVTVEHFSSEFLVLKATSCDAMAAQHDSARQKIRKLILNFLSDKQKLNEIHQGASEKTRHIFKFFNTFK